MDWGEVIRMRRAELMGYVSQMVALLGILPAGSVAAVPNAVRLAVLRILLPAESTLRRLIVIAARGMTFNGVAWGTGAVVGPVGTGSGRVRAPCFRLFDSRKTFTPHRRRVARVAPRISWIGEGETREDEPALDEKALVDASKLCRRVEAMHRALADLPGQARRLARWRARRRLQRHPGKPVKFIDPLRPGMPPGHRERRREAIHETLLDCHWLALRAGAAGEVKG